VKCKNEVLALPSDFVFFGAEHLRKQEVLVWCRGAIKGFNTPLLAPQGLPRGTFINLFTHTMRSKAPIAGITIGIVTLLGMGAQAVYATTYTSAQVASHNTASDCWEIINGKVYNLTAFIPQHPGGQSAVIAQCGKDATTVFNNGPHSASTLSALSAYFLGDLNAASVVTPTTPPTPTPGTNMPSQVAPAPVANPTQTSQKFMNRDDDENDDEDDSDHSDISETRHEVDDEDSEYTLSTSRTSQEQRGRGDSSGDDD